MKTTNLHRTHAARLRDWLSRRDSAQLALLALASILFVAFSVQGVRSVRLPAWYKAEPTPALPIVVLATQQPATVLVTATPAAVAAALPGRVFQSAITVFGGPDVATVIGSVEAGRGYEILARFGPDWIQLNVAGGTGVVFVRSADLFDLPPDLANLEPSPAPQVVYVPQPRYLPPAAAPTLPPEDYRVTNDQSTPELQTLNPPPNEAELSSALLREAQDR